MPKRTRPHRAMRRATIPFTRATYIAARAKNALRRPVFIGSVSVGSFVLALVALIVVPQQVQRNAERPVPPPEALVDTIAPAQELEVAKARLRVAEDSLGRARVAAAQAFRAVTVDTLSPPTIARRDTLARARAAVTALIERAENAPLPSSYRALGDALAQQGETRVLVLLDSLGKIEREREAFGAVGSADPIFVALTSAANDIGRAIVALGEARNVVLAAQISAITPKVESIPAALLATADTVPKLAARDTAARAVATATQALARARQQAIAVRAQEERVEGLSGWSVPPAALLAAALVFGAALGFGAALADEIRQPRLADAREAERVTGLRVLGVVQPRRISPERNRRQSDKAAPPQLDPGADAYQLVYLHVATASPGLLILSVTGDEASVPAIVGTNLAAISAMEARHTLVIDADAAACGVAAVLHTRAEPGIVDLIDRRATTSEAITTASVGRSSVVDVLPSGVGVPLPDATEVAAVLQKEVARLSRRYDTLIVVTSAEHALGGLPASLPSPDLIYCTRVGATRIKDMREAVVALRRAGANPLGVVVWDTLPAVLPTPAELSSGPRPQRTQEMPVMARA